eukprot:1054831-Prorocentrum_minimum.AAC.4
MVVPPERRGHSLTRLAHTSSITSVYSHSSVAIQHPNSIVSSSLKPVGGIILRDYQGMFRLSSKFPHIKL